MTQSQFEKIYQEHFTPVYRYLLKLCQNESLAEELTSDTFFKAMKAIDSFKGESQLSTWLCQIGKNTYLAHLKKANKEMPLEEEKLLKSMEPSSTIEDSLIKKESLLYIHKAIHGLKEPYKEVFMLRVFSSLSFKDIGTIFNKSENWACVTYHRSREKISFSLQDNP